MSHVQQRDVRVEKALKWTSVKFLQHMPGDLTLMPTEKVRFCKAVSRASEGEWILTPETVCCAGAQRCFGCPDSRRYGGIGPEQLVVALPADLLTKMRALTEGADFLFSGG
jgi:uncharacterized protein (DUF169 family)